MDRGVRNHIRQLIRRFGQRGAAFVLDVNRGTLLDAAAGKRKMREGTRVLLEQRLAHFHEVDREVANG